MLHGKALIAQGGGPTAVINQSLVGAVQEARRFNQISAVYGAYHGVSGIINEDLLDLSGETDANLELIAASRDAIDMAEDREQFRNAMQSIGLECPRAGVAHTMFEAWQVQKEIGFPTIVRPSFTLGGTVSPAIFPASLVALRWASMKYAGTVITASVTLWPR